MNESPCARDNGPIAVWGPCIDRQRKQRRAAAAEFARDGDDNWNASCREVRDDGFVPVMSTSSPGYRASHARPRNEEGRAPVLQAGAGEMTSYRASSDRSFFASHVRLVSLHGEMSRRGGGSCFVVNV